jgi:hypothetical protein
MTSVRQIIGETAMGQDTAAVAIMNVDAETSKDDEWTQDSYEMLAGIHRICWALRIALEGAPALLEIELKQRPERLPQHATAELEKEVEDMLNKQILRCQGLDTEMFRRCPTVQTLKELMLVNPITYEQERADWKIRSEVEEHLSKIEARSKIANRAEADPAEDDAGGMDDDPFSMMTGMGEEQEYKVTLMEQVNVGTTEGRIERCLEEVPATGATEGHHAEGEANSCSEEAAANPS